MTSLTIQQQLTRYGMETISILMLTYVVFWWMPSLPWWAVAVTAGIIAFLFNTSTKSFWTGFVGVGMLWFVLAFQMNLANGGVLASKMGRLFGESLSVSLTSTHLIYATAVIGGLVGGLGAMTGNYARKLFISAS